jgi:DNA-directed RNA polymerase subunit RPC12/RpoP
MKDWTDTAMTVICVLLCVLLALLIIFFAYAMYSDIDATTKRVEDFGDGTCPQCGGKFVLKEVIPHRNSASYLFICNGCGVLVELPILPDNAKGE